MAMSNVQEKLAKMHAPEPGTLVAGLCDKKVVDKSADDFNKLLMTIVGHAELLAAGNLSLETQRAYIGRIASATRKIRDQVRRTANSEIVRDSSQAKSSADDFGMGSRR
jgi:hypothetical protein